MMLWFEQSEHCNTELHDKDPVRNGGVFILAGAEIKGEVTLGHGLFPLQRSAAAVDRRNCCSHDFCSDSQVGFFIESKDDCSAYSCWEEGSIRNAQTN